MLSMETEELREQIEVSDNNIMELTHNSGQQRKADLVLKIELMK